MPYGLLLAAFLLALGGGLHCTAMCACFLDLMKLGTPQRYALMAGRLVSYTGIGVVIGAGSDTLYELARAQQAQSIHALWVMAQVAMAAAALWMLVRGVVPALPNVPAPASNTQTVIRWLPSANEGIVRRKSLWLGLLWGALPCGLLYAAFSLAYLSGTPIGGGLVMLTFGLVTTLFLSTHSLFKRALHGLGVRWSDKQWIRVSGLLTLLAVLASSFFRDSVYWCATLP